MSFCVQFHHSSVIGKILILISSIVAIFSGLCVPLIVILVCYILDVSIAHQTKETHREYIEINTKNEDNNKTMSNNYNIVKEISRAKNEILILVSIHFLLCMIYCTIQKTTANKQILEASTKYYKSLFNQDLTWLDIYSHKHHLKRSFKYFDYWRDGIREKFGMLFHLTTMSVWSLLISLAFGWYITLVLFGILPIIVIFITTSRKMRCSFKRWEDEAYAEAEEHVREALVNIKTVFAYGYEHVELDRYTDLHRRSKRLAMQTGSFYGFVMGILWFGLFTCYIVVFRYIAKVVFNHPDHNPKDIFIIFFSTHLFLSSILCVREYSRIFLQTLHCASQIQKVINWPRHDDKDNDEKVPCTPVICGSITFDDVWFSYSTNPIQQVLQGVTFSMEAGTIIGVAGHSRSGKSACLDLISGLYKAHSGLVQIDGQDIGTLQESTLRRCVALVTKDAMLFGTTYWDAICANSPATHLDVVDAARTVEIHHRILQMDRGYHAALPDTLHHEMRTRLALARALVLRPSVLLLDDDALSDLTPTQEAHLLGRIAKDRTVVIVTRRANTLRLAHSVVLLAAGRVVGEGPWQSLAEQRPLRDAIAAALAPRTLRPFAAEFAFGYALRRADDDSQVMKHPKDPHDNGPSNAIVKRSNDNESDINGHVKIRNNVNAPEQSNAGGQPGTSHQAMARDVTSTSHNLGQYTVPTTVGNMYQEKEYAVNESRDGSQIVIDVNATSIQEEWMQDRGDHRHGGTTISYKFDYRNCTQSKTKYLSETTNSGTDPDQNENLSQDENSEIVENWTEYEDDNIDKDGIFPLQTPRFNSIEGSESNDIVYPRMSPREEFMTWVRLVQFGGRTAAQMMAGCFCSAAVGACLVYFAMHLGNILRDKILKEAGVVSEEAFTLMHIVPVPIIIISCAVFLQGHTNAMARSIITRHLRRRALGAALSLKNAPRDGDANNRLLQLLRVDIPCAVTAVVEGLSLASAVLGALLAAVGLAASDERALCRSVIVICPWLLACSIAHAARTRPNTCHAVPDSAKQVAAETLAQRRQLAATPWLRELFTECIAQRLITERGQRFSGVLQASAEAASLAAPALLVAGVVLSAGALDVDAQRVTFGGAARTIMRLVVIVALSMLPLALAVLSGLHFGNAVNAVRAVAAAATTGDVLSGPAPETVFDDEESHYDDQFTDLSHLLYQDKNAVGPASSSSELMISPILSSTPATPSVSLDPSYAAWAPPGGRIIAVVGPGSTAAADVPQWLLDLVAPGHITQESAEEEGLRARIAVVQGGRPRFFPRRTLAANIAYGSKRPASATNKRPRSATIDDVIVAARRIGIHDFIYRLPEGYFTEAGVVEMHMDGVQRLQLALARALLHDPLLLLVQGLPDCTDAAAMKKTEEALAVAAQGRTLVVLGAVASKTVRQADRIFVLEGEGRIRECGTHDALVAARGSYHQLLRRHRRYSVARRAKSAVAALSYECGLVVSPLPAVVSA